MIEFIVTTINALIAAFIWYRIGRHKAFVELYEHLTEVSQELGRVSQLLDAYRKKYAKELVEKEDGEDRMKKEMLPGAPPRELKRIDYAFTKK